MTNLRKNQPMEDQTSSVYDKLPPQALDLEEILLGALLIEGDRFKDVKTLISSDAFYQDNHSKIYDAMRLISIDNGKIDMLTVIEKLKSLDQLEQIGGATYISKLTSRVAGAGHVKYHASIIYDKWVAREIIKLGSEMVQNAYNTDDILDLVQEVRNIMNKRIMHFMGIQSTGVSIIEAATKSIDDYYIREKNIKDGKVIGIPTTLKDVNKITGGLQPQQLIVLAARPGMGKTSLAVSFMITAAAFQKKCAFFSLEMTSARLMDKVICSLTDINHADYKMGRLTDMQKKEVENTIRTIESMDVTFNEEMLADIEQVHALCNMIKEKKGLDVVFIDYLQLMKTKEKTGNREQEVSTISRKAKMMAVELNVPVILMSQLNREVEKRSDKRPMLSDLRESGSIEQDADIVIFIYRDSVYNEDAEKGIGELIISKHREGATGYTEFKHNESLTRFVDYDRNSNITDSIMYDIDLYSKESTPF